MNKIVQSYLASPLGRLLMSVGRRFHPSSEPPQWFTNLFGGSTISGVSVTPSSALGYPAVFSAVRILSESVASLPLHVYERLPGGGKQIASDHPLYRLLHDSANPEMTSTEFLEMMVAHQALRGNAYAEIQRDGAGRPVALWPLHPDYVSVSRISGALQYEYLGSSGTKYTLRPSQVLHLRGLMDDGVMGMSPITYCRQSVSMGMAAEQYGSRLFGQGVRPSGVLESPKALSEPAYKRLQESVKKNNEGLDNAARMMILEEGLKWTSISLSPEDAQFLETRKFQVTEIARIFRIPPHMLADLDRATFSNIEQQSMDFVVNTLRPWLVRLEKRIKMSLFDTLAYDDRFFPEFLVEGMLRGATLERYQSYEIARRNGWMSANEIREKENMNPIEGAAGSDYIVALNMGTPSDKGDSED